MAGAADTASLSLPRPIFPGTTYLITRRVTQQQFLLLPSREVNDIVLQYFDESILRGRERPIIEPINERFQIRNHYIEICSDRVLEDHPSAMLEIFVIMANRRDISGVRAGTIRAIREHLYLIDEPFREDPRFAEMVRKIGLR